MTVGIDQIDRFPWRDTYYDDDLATGANDGTSEADAWQSIAAMIAGAKPGDRVNMKKTGSPVAPGAYITFPPGDDGGPIWYRGYGAVPGDETQWQSDAGAFRFTSSTGPQLFSDLDMTSDNTTTTFNCTGYQTTLYRCKLRNTTSGSAIAAYGNVCIECDIANSGEFASAGYEAAENYGTFIGCKMQSDGVVFDGLLDSDGECMLLFKNVLISDSSEVRDGLQLSVAAADSAYLAVIENSIYGANYGIEVDDLPAAYEASVLIAGNVVAGCDIGLHMSEATYPEISAVLRNAVGDNNASNYTGFGNWEDCFDKVVLSADPYDDHGTLALNDTAGGGADCRDAGVIGLLAGTGAETVDPAGDYGGNRHGPADGSAPYGIREDSGGAGTSVITYRRRVR